MEQRRVQCVLRCRFWFRFSIFIISLIICIAYLKFYSCNPAVWGFILGLSGSTLTWAFVELFDFFVETYHQFASERSQFFLITEDYWSQLRRIFRAEVDIKDIPWKQVESIVAHLYSKVASFPFQGGIYSISKEFETAVTYITRLYWKTHGYIRSVEKKDTQDYWEPFYKVFVLRSKELAKEPVKTLFDFSCINKQIDALRKIDISFQDFSHPEGMIDYLGLGDLGESMSVVSGVIQYKTFKPAYDFHQNFNEKPPHGSFSTVMGLLFRRTKSWK